MKKTILIILFVGLTISCSNNKTYLINLDDNWELQSSNKINSNGKLISSADFNSISWYNINIPKTVLAALVDHQVYPDPYYGENLKSIPGYKEGRWLSMDKGSPFYPTWWYRKKFFISKNYKNKYIILNLDGINYKANVWINGNKIADSNDVIGMFHRFQLDVTEYLKFGDENVLAIEISAPGKVPDITYRTKQIEGTTGWDDHNPQPPDLNMGVWRDVYLSLSDEVILKHPYVVTDLDLPNLDKAFLSVFVDVENKSNYTVNGLLNGTIGDISISKYFTLEPKRTKTLILSHNEFKQLEIMNPKLWWPNPLGEQNLHTLKLEAVVDEEVSDVKNVRFGIREVSTYINDEGWRGYRVNGKNILIRGGAWMTSDMMLNLTKDRYEALIRYAKEANLNALRSEGFSIRETDEFYDLCDEYGVLVIQQIFGRNLPDEKLAVKMIEDMIFRIRNHPSLIHFLGHDETFPTENLDKAYKDLIRKYTPERTYQPHSGAFEIENRFKTGGTRTGTLELWTYATPSHYYTHKEDGAWGFAQSGGIGGIFAPFESIKKIIPEDKLWPVKNETFSFHTVLQGINYFDLVLNSLNERYGEPGDIEELIMKGQALNYESARGMFEAYARNKYKALGITTWKYDAAWPAALTWQYVDWYLNVGGAYYGAKKACEALHVQYSYDDHSIYVVNSLYETYSDLNVEAKIFNIDLEIVFYKNKIVSVGMDDKTEVFKIEWPENLSTTHFLSLKLRDEKNQELSNNFYWLSTVPDIQGKKEETEVKEGWWGIKAKPKSYADFKELNNLPLTKIDSNIKFDKDNEDNIAIISIKNIGASLAFQIRTSLMIKELSSEITPTYWSDNYISVLPGEERELVARFSKEIDFSDVGLQIKGWNIEN